MTTEQIVLGILIGVVAGVLSGLFGVGGGIITTPAIQELLGGSPYIAVGTPLPVAIPTALVGGYTYARAHEVSWRAVRFAARMPGPPELPTTTTRGPSGSGWSHNTRAAPNICSMPSIR